MRRRSRVGEQLVQAGSDPGAIGDLQTNRQADGAESVAVMLSRALDAHESIIVRARELVELVDDLGDPATEDLLGTEVLPVNELQVWYVAEHLVDVPLIDSPSDS